VQVAQGMYFNSFGEKCNITRADLEAYFAKTGQTIDTAWANMKRRGYSDSHLEKEIYAGILCEKILDRFKGNPAKAKEFFEKNPIKI
jgi:hypothetical protein